MLFSFLSWCSLASGPIVEDIIFLDDRGEEIVVEDEDFTSIIGESFNSEVLVKDINTLKDKYPQYQHIMVSVNPIGEEGDFVSLVFEFQVKRVIRSLRILSVVDPKLENEIEIPLDLRKQLRSQRHGEFNASSLERDKKFIANYYLKKGYPEAIVEHEATVSSNGSDVDLIIRIEPKTKKLVVSKVSFEGNNSFKKSELKELIKTRPRSFFLARHRIFNIEQLERDRSDLIQFYNDQGFLDAKISYDFNYRSNGKTKVIFKISEGHRYKVSSYEFIHNDLYPDEDIKTIHDFSQARHYNDKEIRSVLQKIREFYGNKGHAKVEVSSFYDAFNEKVILRIIEGPSFTVEKVVVEGQEKMKVETILRDVVIKENELFSAEKVTNSMKELKASGLYSDVRIDFEPTSNSSGNIIVFIEEAKTQTISFGVGTGTNGISGDFSIQDRNFLNSGNSLSLHVRKMAEMTKIGLLYQDPHLFDGENSLSLSANYQDLEQGEFEERKIAATLMIERRVTENLKLGVGTRIEFLNLSDIDQEIRLVDHHADGKDRILGMVGTLFYKSQSKDSAGDVKEGVKIHMALLPSYADQGAYMKAFASVMATESLYENGDGVSHSITGRLTVGYASENTPFHEKFYAGGNATLRGFKPNSISSEEGDGGQLLLSASAGYSFPIWEDKVKGVVFLEAASVGDSVSDLSNIRAVGGLGVKANLMDSFLGSVIEAGIAIPLRKAEGDELKPFYFIFGEYDPAYDL